MNLGQLDIQALAGLYRLLGRGAFMRAITLPSAPLIKIAEKNKDEPAEIIAKRDTFTEALVDFIEEVANLDND